MKVLIIAQHVNFFRNLETVIRELCRRGHEVVFLHGLDLEDPRAAKKMARKITRGKLVLTRGLENAEADIPGVTSGYRPKAPEASSRVLRYGRQVMNRATYMRKDHPSPTRVVDILEREMPPGLAARITRNPWKALLRQPAAMRAWRRIEDASPPSPTLTSLLTGIAPHVMLVSPAIWPKDLVEADYIHAARALGIPTLGYVNSWDNLTSKGTVHVLPDQFVVWNQPLAREAVDLHLVPADIVRITGAPHLDHFFTMRATATHEEICAEMGCPTDQPYVTYLCSSRTLVNSETDVVTRLAAALAEQQGPVPTLVVRPHPTNPAPWTEYEHPGVVVYPRGGDQADSQDSWQQYFNQLAHGQCVIGLNSTAFLEAAVAGRPCLTIVADEFWDSQGRTGHFRHLLAGDFLEVATSVPDAARRIARVIEGADEKRTQRAEFVHQFLRPRGIDRPAAEVVADLVESSALPSHPTAQASSAQPAPRPTNAWASSALPLLKEWATWLAVDEVRQKLAAHAAFLRSKGDAAPKGRLLFVAPDEGALAQLRPLLHRLSRERHEVTVLVTADAPSEDTLASFENYWGLTIIAAPRPSTSPGPSLDLDVIGLLEDRKPQVLVVVPHRTLAFEAGYLRAARALGIRSVCLPLRWDDIPASPALLVEAPDVFAVWNEGQRRDAMARFTLLGDRVEVTGAALPTDIVEGHMLPGRDAYCERMGIDVGKAIVLIDAPAAPSAEWMALFQKWRRGLKGTANPDASEAAVVVYVHNQDDVATWRRLAQTAEIVVARAGTDQERTGFRLAESIAAADVVVATGLSFMLEAVSRVKPTMAFTGAGGRDAEDLEAFIRQYPPSRELVSVTETTAGGVAQIVIALSKRPLSEIPPTATPVQPRADGTGTERVYQLLEQLTRQDYKTDVLVRPPLWQRLLVLLYGTGAQRTST
ncbi:MAG: hypothetical protein HOP16_02065 [Acidobacteria bacterium]|nr:hypothetical protein [Acidobacteriota bacterium]